MTDPHLAPYPFPESQRRIYAPDEPREPMEITISGYEGFGVGRYVGAATFRARNGEEAAFIHLLCKIDDFAQEGPQGKEWYERLCSVLKEPLDWSEEPRILVEPEHGQGFEPHPTNLSAHVKESVVKRPKPVESKRPGMSLQDNVKPKVDAVGSASLTPRSSVPAKKITIGSKTEPKLLVRSVAVEQLPKVLEEYEKQGIKPVVQQAPSAKRPAAVKPLVRVKPKK